MSGDDRRLRPPQWGTSVPGLLVSTRGSIYVASAPGLLALGLALYQLSLPHVLHGVHGYDDGVYLGASIRLVHGVLPYRDFAFLHPPGSTLLLAPVAGLGRAIGTNDAMVIARILTAAVVGLNAALAALALRFRGILAMLVAGFALALFPLAVTADQSLTLEPFLVCFCLLGIVATFDGATWATPRRLLLGGLAFGFAGSVKIWAIVPVVVILAGLLPRWKTAVRSFVPGIIAGFVVPSAVFFVLAPGAFVHDIFVASLTRGHSTAGAVSSAGRLLMITGLDGLTGLHPTTGLGVVVTAVAGGVVLGVYASRVRTLSTFDRVVLAAASLSVAIMFVPPQFYVYYSYFTAAFLALVLGVCAGRLASALRRAALRLHDPVGWRAATLGVVPPLALVVATGFVIPQDTGYASAYLKPAFDPGTAVAASIPEGACVVFDEAVLAINANRFDPGRSGCPAVVDPYGFWITQDAAHPPPYTGPLPPNLTGTWLSWLKRADYLVEVAPQSDFIPWSQALLAWFSRHYDLVYSKPGVFVYDHYRH